MPYYAVVAGRNPGIYSNWNECKEQISQFPGAWYKKFRTQFEANKCMESKDFFAPLMAKTSHKSNKQGNQNMYNSQMKMDKDESMNIFDVTCKIADLRKKVGKCIEQFTNKIEILSEKLDTVEQQINSVIFRDNPYQSPYTSYDSPLQSSVALPSPYADYPYTDPWEPFNAPPPPPPPIRPLLAPESGYIPPLIEDQDGFIDVYIDGAVTNQGTDKAKGGVGVWFNHGHPLNIAAALDGRATNMNAELQAATRAIQQAAAAGLTKLNIHTDSLYIIKCMTKWINSWRKNNWQTVYGLPVKNREQVEKLDEALNNMEAIKWTHIKSHQGNVGNENADTLAHAGVTMNGVKRFRHCILPVESS